MLCTPEVLNGIGQHQDGKHDEVDARQRRLRALIVVHQAAKAARPRKVALDAPMLGWQYKAMLGFGKPHEVHIDPAFYASLRGVSRSTKCNDPVKTCSGVIVKRTST